MAFCGKCASEVPAMAVICPYCQHDFCPPEPATVVWEYSRTANGLLFIAILLTGIGGCVLAMMGLITILFALTEPSRWQESLWMFGQLMNSWGLQVSI